MSLTDVHYMEEILQGSDGLITLREFVNVLAGR